MFTVIPDHLTVLARLRCSVLADPLELSVTGETVRILVLIGELGLIERDKEEEIPRLRNKPLFPDSPLGGQTEDLWELGAVIVLSEGHLL